MAWLMPLAIELTFICAGMHFAFILLIDPVLESCAALRFVVMTHSRSHPLLKQDGGRSHVLLLLSSED